MDELIKIPSFLSGENGDVVLLACSDFCEHVCETDAMACGQCSGQSCSGQCTSSECSQGCSQSCTSGCQITCQSTCEKGCQSSCERRCQGCEGCESACELTSQNPSPSASLSIKGGPGELTWKISGLSKPFNSGNGYVRAGITKDRFTVGGVNSITGIIDYKSAPTSGTSTTASHTISYRPGTYIFWGFTETRLGGYWPTGSSVTVTVEPEFVSFDWTYKGLDGSGSPIQGTTKQAGLGVYVTADEWNELVDLINDVKGSSIAHVSRGNSISRTTVNKVANALGVKAVSSGTAISASFFNDLRSAYNALG